MAKETKPTEGGAKGIIKPRLPYLEFKGKNGTSIYNDLPDEIWERIPPMKEVERFKLAHRHYVPVQQRVGNEKEGIRETTSGVYVSGEWSFDAKFNATWNFKTTDSDGNEITRLVSSKVCAFETTNDDGPVALTINISGRETNGFLRLERSNPVDVLIYLFLRLAPQVENNLLGVPNHHEAPYDIEYVDDDAAQMARVKMYQVQEEARKSFDEIKEDTTLLYALANSMSQNAPYVGPKTQIHMLDYMLPWLNNHPDLVLKQIQNLDNITLDVDIKDGIDRGIILNDTAAKGFIFPDKTDASKGIVNYLDSDSADAQIKILKKHLMSAAGKNAKLFLRSKLSSLRV